METKTTQEQRLFLVDLCLYANTREELQERLRKLNLIEAVSRIEEDN